MKLDSLIVGLLLFSAVIITFSLLYTDIQTNYGITPDSDKNWQTFNKFNETTSLAANIAEEVQTNQTILPGVNDLVGVVKIGFTSVRMVFSSITTVKDILTSIVELVGIPREFYYILISILLILLAFAIISAIFKYDM